MTYNPMQSVTEFHDKFHRDGKGRHERPISVSIIERRVNLIREEYLETVEALYTLNKWIGWSNQSSIGIAGIAYEENIREKKAEAAKELADLLYVIYGTAEELKIPLQEVFQEVHQSNMGKLWPDGTVHYNDFGKIIKPPTYSPPDIEKILYGE